MIDIYAGKNALKTIQEQGINQALFTNMLGASGGPKWFTLFGLDKYLFGEFFKERQTGLNLIGSSAGAFRFAALAQENPVKAISQLAKVYSETVYSAKADATEVTVKAKELIEAVYQPNGIKQAINNPIFKPHFIVAKCHGLTACENKLLQMLGLISSICLNRVNRGLIAKQYQRFVFHAPESQLSICDKHNFNTQYQPLNNENFTQALLASGSIPMVMRGVNNITGAPSGMYRDGGIIDYHFDIELPKTGLTLYPHFNNQPKAGWFDKNLPREVTPKHYDNVVMLTPSTKFVESLPFNKIPDRKDFTEMDANTRIKYWKTVLNETERLAQAFDQFIQQSEFNRIKRL